MELEEDAVSGDSVEGFEFMICHGDAVLVVQAVGKYVGEKILGAVLGVCSLESMKVPLD